MGPRWLLPAFFCRAWNPCRCPLPPGPPLRPGRELFPRRPPLGPLLRRGSVPSLSALLRAKWAPGLEKSGSLCRKPFAQPHRNPRATAVTPRASRPACRIRGARRGGGNRCVGCADVGAAGPPWARGRQTAVARRRRLPPARRGRVWPKRRLWSIRSPRSRRRRILSSPFLRCVQTVTPLADALRRSRSSDHRAWSPRRVRRRRCWRGAPRSTGPGPWCCARTVRSSTSFRQSSPTTAPVTSARRRYGKRGRRGRSNAPVGGSPRPSTSPRHG